MKTSAVAFFVLAGVGCLCGVDVLTCGLRALAGAACVYVMTVFLGRMIVRILVNEMLNAAAPGDKGEEPASE